MQLHALLLALTGLTATTNGKPTSIVQIMLENIANVNRRNVNG
jgi:hypothetical protein